MSTETDALVGRLRTPLWTFPTALDNSVLTDECARDMRSAANQITDDQKKIADLEALLGGICAFPMCDCGVGSECMVLDAPVPEVVSRDQLIEAHAELSKRKLSPEALAEVRLEIMVYEGVDDHESAVILGVLRNILDWHGPEGSTT